MLRSIEMKKLLVLVAVTMLAVLLFCKALGICGDTYVLKQNMFSGNVEVTKKGAWTAGTYLYRDRWVGKHGSPRFKVKKSPTRTVGVVKWDPWLERWEYKGKSKGE